MKTRLITAVLLAFGIAGLTACANTDTESPTPDDGEIASSGMALNAQLPVDTEVDRIRFQIAGVNCETGTSTGFSETTTRDLEDMTLPGGIAQFEDAPFDDDSEHVFADAFFLVDAGCYDVTTQPLDDAGQEVCQPATRDRVAVEDGQTTEILLINQCEGVERGGLDVISAINHPPEIADMTLNKFISSCPTDTQENEVCVTANDPDDDPLEFEWSANGGTFQGDIVETSSTELEDGRWRSCAQVAANRVGDYNFDVTIYDLSGQGERMEQVLDDQGNPAQSRDSISFPIYSGVACDGRRATILMAIGDFASVDGPNSHNRARRLIRQTASWASPLFDKDETDVLYVLDDNHNNEHLPQDRIVVSNTLENNFDDVDEMVEPSGGLSQSDVADYDLVWFTNPGWPFDDQQSRNVLRNFSQNGGGVVLEGNDMSRATFDEDGLQYFTGVDFQNNGTTTCGDDTDNLSGNHYVVEFDDEPHPAIDGLEGDQILYENDIDHVNRLLAGERVLATAAYSSGDCAFEGPAVTSISPIDE